MTLSYSAASHTNERDWEHDHHRILGLSPNDSRSITMSPSAKIARTGDVPVSRLGGQQNQWGPSNYNYGHNGQGHEQRGGRGHNGRSVRSGHIPLNAHNDRQHQAQRQPQRQHGQSREHRQPRSQGRAQPRSQRHDPRYAIPSTATAVAAAAASQPRYDGRRIDRTRRDQTSNESEIYEQYGGDINSGATDTASIAPSLAAGGHGADGRRLPSRVSAIVANGHRFKNRSGCSQCGDGERLIHLMVHWMVHIWW